MKLLFTFLLFTNSIFAQSLKTLDSLSAVLEKVYDDDQLPREALDSIEANFGYNSLLEKEQWQLIHDNDAKNVLIVINILAKYGWLGSNQVSKRANSAIFLVLQHADPAIQVKYVDIFESAVNEGKARAVDFAYFQDRVNMHAGKFQVYGTQMIGKEGCLYFYPIIDPENVNERRKNIGLKDLEILYNNLPIKALSGGNSLGNKKIVYGFAQGVESGSKLANVKVLLNSAIITETDSFGFYEFILEKAPSNNVVIFHKDGFEDTKIWLKDEGKDVYHLSIGLREE